MKKGKAGSNRAQEKPGRISPWRLLFHIVFSPILWGVILLAAIAAVGYLQWPMLTAWVNDFTGRVWRLFGWGLIIVGLVIATAIIIIKIHRVVWVFRHWRHTLGALILVCTAWGVLAFFPGSGMLHSTSLGGDFAFRFTSYSMIEGIFRMVGLLALGIVLLAPRATFRSVRATGQMAVKAARRRKERKERKTQAETAQVHAARAALAQASPIQPVPAASPVAVEEPPQPKMAKAKKAAEKPKKEPGKGPLAALRAAVAKVTPRREQKSEALEPFPDTIPPKKLEEPRKAQLDEKKAVLATSHRDLKQVALDVWRKYGEGAAVMVDGWKLPPLDILDVTQEVQYSQSDNVKRAKLIEEALSSYGVDAKVVQINSGPTVTQFGLEPGWDRKVKEIKEKDKEGNTTVRMEEQSRTRVKVDRITSLSNDLSLALAAPSIRIEAPVPGKSIVGVEVPNTISSPVSMRSVIETTVFQKMLPKSRLTIALGKGAGGEAVAGDLTKMPHLLVAGATGSGKTVCLNALICCVLLHNTPYDVRFMLIDPKRVEMVSFNGIPHLACPVIVDAEKAVEALQWLTEEMNRRYETLASAGSRNIDGYNRGRQGKEKMPYLVLIIDELADLMMTGGEGVEHTLCRLAQLARAVGIHLVVATQRPSVDVITGLIKANFPTRISFAVTSQVDSRTILDSGGAEKLLGKGDMLYMPTEAAKPKRLQGCYVSDPELERLVFFWGKQHTEDTSLVKLDEMAPASGKKGGAQGDSLLETARQLAEEHKNISTSFLQRRLRIGYPRAARLMEQLEEEGFTGSDNVEEEEPPAH